MLKFFSILSVLLNLLMFKSVKCVNSPCPNIFRYQSNGNEQYGVINIGIVAPGQTVRLHVHLLLQARLTTNYVGALELLEGQQKTIQKVYEHKPILYRVRFPTQHPIPTVTEITANNLVLCRSSTKSGPYSTKIHLEHVLTTVARPIALNSQEPAIRNPSQNNRKIAQPIIAPKQVTHSNYDGCGRIDAQYNIRRLVVGGEKVDPGSWPWLAAIFLNGRRALRYKCVGTLLSSRAVITAAHCFHNRGKHYNPENVLVALGRFNIRNWNEPNSVVIGSSAVHSHPEYDASTFDADIAIIMLKSPVIFTDTIRPVCMWSGSSGIQEVEGHDGIVVGWGKDESGQAVSATPKKIQTTLYSRETCAKTNDLFRPVTTKRTFCAGQRNGRGPCSGDSGGGLMIFRKDRWELRGTVAGSLADIRTSSCDLNELIIYVDVTMFYQWIMQFVHQ